MLRNIGRVSTILIIYICLISMIHNLCLVSMIQIIYVQFTIHNIHVLYPWHILCLHDRHLLCVVSLIHIVSVWYPWYRIFISRSRILFYIFCISSHQIFIYLASDDVETIVYLSQSFHEKVWLWAAFDQPSDLTELHAKFDGDR